MLQVWEFKWISFSILDVVFSHLNVLWRDCVVASLD